VAKIAGYRQSVYMSPPGSHFSEVNLLGMDFCTGHGFRTWVDAAKRIATYYIGNNWEKPEHKH
jgi:hypothetical protein